MNARLSELLLPHRLPIAVFTVHRGEGGRTEFSRTPFCEYSPEYQGEREHGEMGSPSPPPACGAHLDDRRGPHAGRGHWRREREPLV